MTMPGDEMVQHGPAEYLQIVVSEKRRERRKRRVEPLGRLDTGYSMKKSRRKGKEDI